MFYIPHTDRKHLCLLYHCQVCILVQVCTILGVGYNIYLSRIRGGWLRIDNVVVVVITTMHSRIILQCYILSRFPALSPENKATREHGEPRIWNRVSIRNLEKYWMNQRENWHTGGKHSKEYPCSISRDSSPDSKLRRQFKIEKWQYKNVRYGHATRQITQQ